MINDRLLSIQRYLLLGVTKCYGTALTDELIILLEVLSLDLCAGMEGNYVTLTRKKRSVEGTDLSPDNVEIWNTVSLRQNL